MAITADSGHTKTLRTRSSEEPGPQSQSLRPRVYLDVGWPCLFAASIGTLYFRNGSGGLWVSFAGLCGIIFLAPKRIPMKILDWIALVIGLLEAPSLLFSQDRANSVRGALAIGLFAVVYYAVRLTMRSPLHVACLSGIFGISGGLLAIFGFVQFQKTATLLNEVGLTNFVAFRSRLISPTNPWIAGEWFTLVLLTLPFACAVSAYVWQENRKWLFGISVAIPILIGAILLLSLSRAVFGSLALFCMAFGSFLVWARIVPARKGAVLLCSGLAALLLILALESTLFPGVLQAYTGRHASQTRSTEGRIAIWRRSLEVIREHPLWGVGGGNSALALASSTDTEETTGFASRTFNLPFQVLAEKGIIGFVVYGSFLVLVGREFVVGLRRDIVRDSQDGVRDADASARTCMACCFGAGIAGVLLRELLYSSLFEHTLTLALFAVLCALVVQTQPELG